MKRQDGMALLTAIAVTLTMALLGIALINFVSTDTKNTIFYGDQLQAYYVARAGADAVATWLINDPKPPARAEALDGLTSNRSSIKGIDNNLIGDFEVNVYRHGYDIYISSTAFVGRSRETVNVKLTRLAIPFEFDKALSVGTSKKPHDQTIILNGAARIKGPVYLGAGKIGFLNEWSTRIEGDVYIGEGATEPTQDELEKGVVTGTIIHQSLPEPPEVPALPPVPNAPTFSYEIPPATGVIELKDLQSYIVNGDEVLEIEINEYFSWGTNIVVSGSGNLTLIVNGNLSNWGGGKITKAPGSSVNLTLVFRNNIELKDAAEINADFIYVGGEKASFGTSSVIKGDIYVPNGSLSTVDGTSISGTVVVGKNVTLNGADFKGTLVSRGTEVNVNSSDVEGDMYITNELASFTASDDCDIVGNIYSAGLSAKIQSGARLDGEIHLTNTESELEVAGDGGVEGTIYSAGKSVEVKGGSAAQFIYGSNPEATIKIDGGSETRNGSIITSAKEVIFTGGTLVYDGIVFAPNASMTVGGGSRVVGAVVCDTFDGGRGTESGDPVLEYKPIAMSSLPIPILGSGSDETNKGYMKVWFD